MKILSRYFSKQMLLFFVMLLLVLSGLAWMMQILTMLKFLIQYGVNIWGFLGLTSMMLPFIISIITPFAIFIAVMFIYNKMISDQEITVMASAGLSPMQLSRPAISVAGIVAAMHFVLNIWIVPATQAKFYDMQWEMRYGLAHLKLQESTFTQMSRWLVVFVEKVNDHDLSNFSLFDSRDPKVSMIISAEKGKLVNTPRGLSLIMTGGNVQYKSDTFTIGTFDSFDMDMNVSDRGSGGAFKVRRIPTNELLFHARSGENLSDREYKMIISEMSTRFLGPLMDMILVLIAATMLLKSSLLRRRGFNMAAPTAVIMMAGAQALFMTTSEIAASIIGLVMIGAAQIVAVIILLFVLKGTQSIKHKS